MNIFYKGGKRSFRHLKEGYISSNGHLYAILLRVDNDTEPFIVFKSESKERCHDLLLDFYGFYERGAKTYSFPEQ